MATTKQVIAQPLTQAGQEDILAPDAVPDPVGQDGAPVARVRTGQGPAMPHRAGAVTVKDLPDDCRRLLQVPVDGRPMQCHTLTWRLAYPSKAVPSLPAA